MLLTKPIVLTDFSSKSNIDSWRVVDDVVMGGRSQGEFRVDDKGYAVFSGKVSLENNGGFSSVRQRFESKDVRDCTRVVLQVKGDGNRYQFRLKSNSYDRHSYIAYFETTGKMQEIEIELSDMYPTFRGMKLNMPNYSSDQLEEVAFLISNKRAEQFRLEIHKITLK